MPPPLSLLLLPDSIRDEVNVKIRAACYGNVLEITEWLGLQGHVVGKSSVGRYAQRLQLLDAKNGHAVAAMLPVQKTSKKRGMPLIAVSPVERDMLDVFRTFSLAEQGLWITHLKGHRPIDLSTIKPSAKPVSTSE